MTRGSGSTLRPSHLVAGIRVLISVLIVALFFGVQVNETAVMKYPAATENASAASAQIVHVDNRPAKVSVTTEDGAGLYCPFRRQS